MKKSILLLFTLCHSFFSNADQWIQKADFGGTPRNGNLFFSIGNKGYIGIGTDSYPVYNFKNDFWEYDPQTDIWTQKASFPGLGRYTAISFSIGTKGYMGTGWNQTAPLFNDFWQYDQTTNTWLQKGNFPGPLRQGGIGLVINNKAYAGFGHDNNSTFKDFYSYNDSTDVWTPVALFQGASRLHAFCFALNGKGYIGAGCVSYPNYNFVNDMWEYDPVANAWSQKANFPGLPRFQLGFFSINNIGYAGMGEYITNGSFSSCYNDFYAYDPVSNLWSAKSNYPISGGAGIQGGFTIDSSGYTGCGYNLQSGNLNSFWQYIPDMATGFSDLQFTNYHLQMDPNPAKDFIKVSIVNNQQKATGKITVADVSGKIIYTSTIISNETVIDVKHFANGIYTLQLRSNNKTQTAKFIKQ